MPRGSHAATCPVRALTAWLERISGSGPIFRAVDRLGRVRPTRLSDRDVARIVTRAAVAAGLDPARNAGHSLRAGLATSAAAGVEERAIVAQTGHRSVAVARRYIRDGLPFRGNAVAAPGL
jgi:integrase